MLQEPVLIHTISELCRTCGRTSDGVLEGDLFVGADGLPELKITCGQVKAFLGHQDSYRPATFPAAWSLRNTDGSLIGLLLETWNTIGYLRDRIIIAQREEEEEARREPDDDITTFKRDAEARGER